MRIPPALRGESAASTHFENVRGAKSQPERENRVLVRCVLESKPQKPSVMRRYLNVKVRVLQIHGCKPVPGANLRQDLLQRYHPETDRSQSALLMGLRSKIGEAPHPSWVPRSSGCKTRSPARVEGLALLLLSRADSQSLASEPGHFEAMLETAPRH